MTLAVPEIFSAALRLTWQQRRALFDLALIPIIASMIIGLVIEPLLIDRFYTVALRNNPTGTLLGIFALLLLSLLPWAAFAVAWTRYCLIGPEQGAASITSWTMREARYYGSLLKLFLVFIGCLFAVTVVIVMLRGGGIPTTKTMVMMGFGVLLAGGFILARFSLILPAAAVDQSFSLTTALRYSQGNGWRLFAVLILLLLLAEFGSLFTMVLASGTLAWIFGSPLTAGPLTVVLLIKETVGYFLDGALIAATALAFRTLTGWRPNGELRPLPQSQANPNRPGV